MYTGMTVYGMFLDVSVLGMPKKKTQTSKLWTKNERELVNYIRICHELTFLVHADMTFVS
jgi:hypothetical protein